MKSTTNVFQEGLRTDLHPLSTSQKVLTDALNATMITYNGNEMMLQNDMGNTLIQDSKTGHIMGLSEGFVPVGLKEHGGIMYIASVNKDGVGEIGTIPSPILKLELRREGFDFAGSSITTNTGPVSTMTAVTDFKIYPGEKFLPAFNFDAHFPEGVPSKFVVYNTGNNQTEIDLSTRLISPVKEGEGCQHTGLYEMKLFSIYGSQSTELKNVYKKQMRPFKTKSLEQIDNDYWYYPGIITSDVIDVENTWLNKGFHTYPGNLPAGKLAIKAELESIESFDLPKISQNQTSKQQGTKAPYIYKQDENYILAFPGFEYKTKSIRFIGALDITLTNQTTENIKDHKTIEEFSTVNISGDQYNHYQIQAPNQENYEKIEVDGKYQNDLKTYFKPLFEVNIGQDLNAWYRLEVKYKDIYEGDIDTFVYSFNPYHILNFDESYYGVEWKGNTTSPQWFDMNSSTDVSIIDESTYYSTSPGGWFCQVGFTENQTAKASDMDYQVFKWPDPQQEQPYGTVVLFNQTVLNKKGSCKYLFTCPNLNPTFRIGNLANPTFRIGSSDHQYYTPLKALNESNIALNIKYTVDRDQKDIQYTQPLMYKENADSITVSEYNYKGNYYHEYYLHKGDYATSLSDLISQQYDGQEVDLEVTLQFQKSPNGYFAVNKDISQFIEGCGQMGEDQRVLPAQLSAGGYIEYFCTMPSNGEEYPFVKIDPITVPNQSPYSLTPSFSLFGSTDEKSNIRLGLDRTGQPKEAWTLGENLYQTCMPVKNTNDQHLSSFEKDTYYYNTTDLGSNLILDQGIYLITVDAGTFNEVGNFYSPDGETVNDLNTYGCNVDWNDNTQIDGDPLDNPKIAVFIQNTPYQLARVDSMYKGARHRTFVPTLLYLPQQSIIRIEWKNIQKLQGIGLFRVTRPVIFNDGTGFDSGDQIRLMYYQHPDLREIILPLEATYYEHVNCLDKEYDYYRGVSSLDTVNHHIIIDNIQFCKAPDRPGTIAYGSENIDPTYLWDASVGTNDEDGDGLQDFIYQYNPDSLQSTIIPAVGGNKNELVYRVLNTEL